MNIKSSQTLVEEAQKSIETLSSSEVKTLYDNKEITLIDVRDIRELWKEGTIENSKHIPRGMLEFWLDPESTYYQSNKIKDIKKIVLFCALGCPCFAAVSNHLNASSLFFSNPLP